MTLKPLWSEPYPGYALPSTACVVQHKLEQRALGVRSLSRVLSIRLCASTGAQFIATGAHKKVLVIGADVMSSIIDYTDRATCVIFGDGAGAVLLEPAEDDSVGLIDFMHEIDGSGGCALYMPAVQLAPFNPRNVEKKMHYVHQDGRRFSSTQCARWPIFARRFCGVMASKAATSMLLFRIRPTGASLRHCGPFEFKAGERDHQH